MKARLPGMGSACLRILGTGITSEHHWALLFYRVLRIELSSHTDEASILSPDLSPGPPGPTSLGLHCLLIVNMNVRGSVQTQTILTAVSSPWTPQQYEILHWYLNIRRCLPDLIMHVSHSSQGILDANRPHLFVDPPVLILSSHSMCSVFFGLFSGLSV